MKPLRIRLRDAAGSISVGQQVIEKDYALSYILAGIAAQSNLAEALVFKGGTALKKLYFGNYRFSEDLDFSAINAPQGDELESAIRLAVTHAKRLLTEHGPFTLDMTRYHERVPHPHGQEAFVVRVQFPWHPSPLCRVKMEISHDEPVIMEPDSRTLIHSYEEQLNPSIRCYCLEEIIAEKMRCLLQTQAKLLTRGWNRPRARDYYDLWRLFTTYGSQIDKNQLPSLLQQKCAHRNVGYSRIEDFFTPELMTEAKTHWQGNLRPFVSELPECELVLHDLRTLMDAVLQHLI
jgi:predicted nucleotidyltransferase component of viral defense system